MKLYSPFLRMSLGLAVLSTAFLLGCEPEDLGIQLTPDDGTRTVTIGVSAETSATKAEIGDDLVFSWTAGDQIAVWAGSEGSGQYYTSEAYAGGNTFSINLAGTRGNYAVYPAGIEVSDAATASSLKVKLPAEYDFTAAGADYSPLPMVAVNTEGHDLAFYHLGGLLRITLGDLPSGTSYVTVDLGKPINGIFPVHLESDGSYIVNTDEITDGSNVTKFLVPSPTSGSVVLNLPVPTGSYESVTVTAYDGDNNVLGSDSPTFSWNCARAHGKKLTDDDLGWVYVFGSLTDGTVPYSGGDVTLASAFQSYRYRGTEVEEVPYVVEYSLDGETWRTEAPDWLTGAPTSSTGSIDGEDLALTVAPQVNSAPDPHHDVLAARTPKTGFDLSTLNVATGETVSRSTANCYVVQAPGTYKFPLVYGNGVKNGAVNESAYRAKAGPNATSYLPDDGATYYQNGEMQCLGSFKDHLDNNIYNGGDATSSPYLTTHLNKEASEFTPVLIWTDVPGLINVDADISGSGENSYLTFSVPKEYITQGNALVAVLVDDDADGTPETIAWSWHIWITEDNLTYNNTPVPTSSEENANVNYFAPVNLGWCEGKSETYKARECKIRILQAGNTGEQQIVTLTQTDENIVTRHNNIYFEWGRKDPVPASAQSTTAKKYYPTDILYTPSFRKALASLGTTIQTPYRYYNQGVRWCDTRYINLWNSVINRTGPNYKSIPVTKTIYDPSPVGYKMPPGDAFGDFNEETCIWSEGNGDISGRTYKSSLFFPATGYFECSFDEGYICNTIGCYQHISSYANYHMALPSSTTGGSWINMRSDSIILGLSTTGCTHARPVRPVLDN